MIFNIVMREFVLLVEKVRCWKSPDDRWIVGEMGRRASSRRYDFFVVFYTARVVLWRTIDMYGGPGQEWRRGGFCFYDGTKDILSLARTVWSRKRIGEGNIQRSRIKCLLFLNPKKICRSGSRSVNFQSCKN